MLLDAAPGAPAAPAPARWSCRLSAATVPPSAPRTQAKA